MQMRLSPTDIYTFAIVSASVLLLLLLLLSGLHSLNAVECRKSATLLLYENSLI